MIGTHYTLKYFSRNLVGRLEWLHHRCWDQKNIQGIFSLSSLFSEDHVKWSRRKDIGASVFITEVFSDVVHNRNLRFPRLEEFRLARSGSDTAASGPYFSTLTLLLFMEVIISTAIWVLTLKKLSFLLQSRLIPKQEGIRNPTLASSLPSVQPIISLFPSNSKSSKPDP